MPILEFKVVMIGAVAVGKTSIVNRIQYAQFEEDYQPTIGAGYVPYKTVYDGKDVELQIWDTAGMERYRSLGPIYYRDAVAAIIVYDQTDKESADALEKWLSAFRATVKTGSYIVVAGNKDDLVENKVVANESVRQWCEENGFDFFLTSAKTGKGVNEMFEKVVQTLVRTQGAASVSVSQSQSLAKQPTGASNGCC